MCPKHSRSAGHHDGAQGRGKKPKPTAGAGKKKQALWELVLLCSERRENHSCFLHVAKGLPITALEGESVRWGGPHRWLEGLG